MVSSLDIDSPIFKAIIVPKIGGGSALFDAGSFAAEKKVLNYQQSTAEKLPHL
jgi:hypothetical protein